MAVEEKPLVCSSLDAWEKGVINSSPQLRELFEQVCGK